MDCKIFTKCLFIEINLLGRLQDPDKVKLKRELKNNMGKRICGYDFLNEHAPMKKKLLRPSKFRHDPFPPINETPPMPTSS